MARSKLTSLNMVCGECRGIRKVWGGGGASPGEQMQVESIGG